MGCDSSSGSPDVSRYHVVVELHSFNEGSIDYKLLINVLKKESVKNSAPPQSHFSSRKDPSPPKKSNVS